MKKIILGLLLIALCGCGGGGGGGGGSSANKSVWSTWTSSSDDFVMNLYGGAFGVPSLFYFNFEPSGATCGCDFVANGNNSSGSYMFSSCAYTSGGSGDPGCASLDVSGTYTNNGTNLTACDTGCVTYH